MTLSFNPLIDIRCRLGESPVYDERAERLYFVDIPARQLHCLHTDQPGNGAPALRSWNFDSEVCSLGLAASGRLVVALRDRVVLFDPQTEGRQELCAIEADRPETRLNDGKVGPDGAFWVGSMDDRPEKQPIGALYRVTPSGEAERKVEGLTISNGLAWTADGETMFHADSRGPWIDRWAFDRWTGKISWRTRIAEPNAVGRPDGGACDAEGCYWSAGVSAGKLNRYAQNGSLVMSYELPLPAPTMPCFGGADFRTLFLTSLIREDSQAAATGPLPLSGALLAAEAPVAGFAPWRFLDI